MMQVTVTRSAPYHVVGFQGNGRYGRSQFRKRDYETHVGGRTFRNTSKAELESAVRRHVRKLAAEAGFLTGQVQFTYIDEPGPAPAPRPCKRAGSHGSHDACPGVDFPRDFVPRGSFTR